MATGALYGEGQLRRSPLAKGTFVLGISLHWARDGGLLGPELAK